MYRPTVQIPVIAKYANGTPRLLPQSAGIVMMNDATDTAMTAYRGTRCRLTRRNSAQPGIPLSREKAYHVRDALVSPAAPQNSWPTVAIISTALAAAEVSALENAAGAAPPAAVTPFTSVTANRMASSNAHPAMAE